MTPKVYLSEIVLNSELTLYNNSEALKKATIRNFNPLSRNDKFKKSFKELHNKLVFREQIPKYNSKGLKELEKLRREYFILDNDSSAGLQKVKRELRDKIRKYSFSIFVDRDPNIFGEMILHMQEKMLNRPNFSGYSFKNEMKSLSSEHILKYTWRFMPFKQSIISGQYVSAFAYLSTTIYNAYVAVIKEHSSQQEKAKSEFLETQKLFHRDPNISTYIKDHSDPNKYVNLININGTLLGHIKKIIIDASDIVITYNKDYKIDLDEWNKISKYIESLSFNDNKVNISLKKDS